MIYIMTITIITLCSVWTVNSPLYIIPHVVCLKPGPQPPPKWALHSLQSNIPSFNFQYSLFSLRPSSSPLRLLPLLPVTSVFPSIFPSVTCFKTRFQCNLWNIKLAFPLFTVLEYYSPSCPFVKFLYFSYSRSNWYSPSNFNYKR